MVFGLHIDVPAHQDARRSILPAERTSARNQPQRRRISSIESAFSAAREWLTRTTC